MADLERKYVEKDGKKPVERDRRQFDVHLGDVSKESREAVTEQILENLLIDLRSGQNPIEVGRREVLFSYRHQRPGTRRHESHRRTEATEKHTL